MAEKANKILGSLPDEQKLSSFLLPWDHSIKEFPESTISEWAKFLNQITPRESWTLEQLFKKFTKRFRFETFGEVRKFCSQKGEYLKITRRSMDFTAVAFEIRKESTQNI